MAGTKQRKFWGWGYEDTVLSADEEDTLLGKYASRFDVDSFDRMPVPKADEIDLVAPRLKIPTTLERICTTDHRDRLCHTYGKSFRDTLRAFSRDFANAPDVIAYPETEADVVAILDWADGAKAAVIPFGGGSSVVGGIEPAVDDRFKGTISLDLARLDTVLEIDHTSRTACIQAGIFGPALESALKPEGLTLRHFPQSFEFSTLGGWIATRSGGHFATLYTHIDDFVENLRVITPAGIVESRRLPGSGAGPSPDRLFIGSEGALGIITEASLRLQNRPKFRASIAVSFDDFYVAADAVRVISQSGLFPSNVRLLDPVEARINGAGDGEHAIVVLAFESADHPVETWMDRGLEICAEFGGKFERDAAGAEAAQRSGAAGAWRDAFIRMPYYREVLVPAGVINATFETAITWDRFRDFHDRCKTAVEDAIERATGKSGVVTCRFTHVYPDGPAPYFTWHAVGRHGALPEQWETIKGAASDAVIDAGGTITHHHAVGRDHMPWYVKQRPKLYGDALAAAKTSLDPSGLLNPGVLVP